LLDLEEPEGDRKEPDKPMIVCLNPSGAGDL
jgi:hypothetical protein